MRQTRTVSPAGCISSSQCIANPGCQVGVPTPTPRPTCTISLSPSSLNLVIGGTTGTITATVSCTASVDNVTFTVGDTTIATISPGTDSTSPYRTTVTAVNPGVTTVTGVVSSGGQPAASDSTVVNAAPPAAWWQVQDSDVTTSGDLGVTLPSGIDFDIPGGGGYPGIPSYGTSTNLTNSTVSPRGWIVKNNSTNQRLFDYSTIIGQIPSEISSAFNTISSGDDVAARLKSGSATHDSNDYYWFSYTGSSPITLSDTNLGARKAILLTKGGLNITGNVNITDGQGFFMVASGGNINVASTVGGTSGPPHLEGIYETDGSFSDSVSDQQLRVRGSVVAYGGVNLQRDLGVGNVSEPGELFEYAPDQILLYPSKLGSRRINWKEVAP